MAVKNTYYWRVSLITRDFNMLALMTPGYDEEHCREISQNWWRGGWLRGDNLRVTAHLHYVLTPDRLVQWFENAEWLGAYPSSARKPTIKKPKWVLVQMVPEVMEASKRALSEARMSRMKPVPTLDEFRTNALRALILVTYGTDEDRGWTLAQYKRLRDGGA